MKNEIKNLIFTYTEDNEANQSNIVPFVNKKEYILGRSIECDLQVDKNLDVVSRKHAAITFHIDTSISISLKDLNSTNGLFINDQKVNGSSELMPGDKIRLGKKGPVIHFDLDPRPDSLVSKTKVFDVTSIEQATKQFDIQEAPKAAVQAPNSSNKPSGIGKATVERMIQKSEKKASSRTWMLGGLALAFLVLSGMMLLKDDEPKMPYVPAPVDTTLSTAEIVTNSQQATVKISTSYKLVYTPTGEDIYHYYELVDGVPTAMYVTIDGQVEPYCVSGKPNSYSQQITNSGSGTGFVINSDGYIITNRHVAASWNDTYSFPPNAFPGKLMYINEFGELEIDVLSRVSNGDIGNWVPNNLMTLNNTALDDKVLDGEIFYLDVIFPGDENPFEAKISRVSPQHDVALLKIDHPGSIKAVSMIDTDIQSGMEVTVMGYPVVSATEYKMVNNKTFSHKARTYREVARPSVFNGIISKTVGITDDINDKFGLYSEMGESYQLDINATGAGNSGGPMFDKNGNVVGIYYAGRTMAGGSVSFAVPIKYALDLVGIKSDF